MNQDIVWRIGEGKKVKPYLVLMLAAICKDSILIYLRIFVSLLPGIGTALVPYVYPAFFSFFAIASISSARLRRIRIIDILFILLFFAYLYHSVMTHPENKSYVIDQFGYIMAAIPYFFLGITFDMDDESMDIFSKYSCVAIGLRIFYTAFLMRDGRFGDDNMGYAYILVPNIMLVINYALRTKKSIPSIISMLGIMYLFAMGTRGPIVIVGIFGIICLWRYSSKSRIVKIFLTVVALVLILLVVYSGFYMVILGLLRELLEVLGVSTRIVDYLISAEFLSETSSRDYIFDYLVAELETRPQSGFGFYGEWKYGFYSAHNMYLEIMFHNGYLLGGMLLGLYVLIYLVALRKSRNTVATQWLIIWGCQVFVKGIFGGRYVSDTTFFLLGMCINSIRLSKTKTIENCKN